MNCAYLIGVAGLMLIWLAFWIRADSGRRMTMLRVSGITALTGLAEPLFLSAYWNPPSLFDLNDRLGVDIESVAFSFAAGGMIAAIYTGLRARSRKSLRQPRWGRPVQIVALVIPIPVFVALVATTNVNPIYITIIALSAGVTATCACWPARIPMICAAGFLFMGLYFGCFVTFTAVYPDYLSRVWNLPALSGVMVVGVPVEELLFALSYGFMYSGVAEYFANYK
ncbi:lycopene cyclase domain-containing protein [Mycobacterium gastri]|uniref:Lycopene cyclase domain-containing protein n=1 Tax=Mycobacterium gastri TaxID=1777 RepID=A0A1X1VCN2_MYCGS|nr:lycopene cyclase domain-containing protein [Mycobacterium gastri]ETW22635.1 hypothetical protein MGAST_18985 [Mycobacterium gastri 'Wayne']ORV66832.1 hypothetical protein AWC07_10250 [Mycobacterium gastri]